MTATSRNALVSNKVPLQVLLSSCIVLCRRDTSAKGLLHSMWQKPRRRRAVMADVGLSFSQFCKFQFEDKSHHLALFITEPSKCKPWLQLVSLMLHLFRLRWKNHLVKRTKRCLECVTQVLGKKKVHSRREEVKPLLFFQLNTLCWSDFLCVDFLFTCSHCIHDLGETAFAFYSME